MSGIVVVDSNILVLIAVGATSRNYISKHKNTKDHFVVDDFELLGLIIKEFSEIAVVAHIVAETSSLLRQIGEPKKSEIQQVFSDLVSSVFEIPVPSIEGINRDDSLDLGVTDAVILHLCSLQIDGVSPTLLTIDSKLADRAHALGYSVIDYGRDFQS